MPFRTWTKEKNRFPLLRPLARVRGAGRVREFPAGKHSNKHWQNYFLEQPLWLAYVQGIG